MVRIPGSDSVWWLKALGAVLCVIFIVAGVIVFKDYGYIQVSYLRHEFNAIEVSSAIRLIFSGVFLWVLSKAIAAGVENTIWIREELALTNQAKLNQ